ncbi:MAG: membrane protein insertion efficiency factor YidD [Candidatus Babeliales bacterium]
MATLLHKARIMVSSLVAYSLITILVGLRPLLGPAACRYDIGCTQFAVIQLESLPLHKALWAIGTRLLSCNPFFISKGTSPCSPM